MKRTVYIETTIVSYLSAWPSRDLIMAANQETTREWWSNRKDKFEVFIEAICRTAGFEPPVICTPQELLEEGEGNA
jgi:hypothetical protein